MRRIQHRNHGAQVGMKGFSFCYDCMAHHRENILGRAAHLFGLVRQKADLLYKQPATVNGNGGPACAPASLSGFILLRRTRDDFLRPDENNLAKEIKIAARATELAGKMTRKKTRLYRHRIAKAQKEYGYDSRFWKETELYLAFPHDLSSRPKNR